MKRKHTRNPRVIYPRGTKLLNVKEYVDEIAIEENKGVDFDKLTYMDRNKIWWKCNKCNSLYEMSPSSRMIGKACPYCAGKRVNATNSLEGKYPEVLDHWDWDLNVVLPNKILAGEIYKKINFICPKCKRRYKTSVSGWIKAKECCPYCRDHIYAVLKYENSLAGKYPMLIMDWDFSKNNEDPAHMSPSSLKEMHWRCSSCGETWKAQVRMRVNGRKKCPNCYPK